jgi:hypothetical protein
MSTSTVLEYAPPAPLTRGRLAARLALFALFVATGIVLGWIAGGLVCPRPEYQVSTYLALDSIPPGLPPAPGQRALIPSEVPTAAQVIVSKLSSTEFRDRIATALNSAGIKRSAAALKDRLDIAYVPNTTLILIKAVDPDIRTAGQISVTAASIAPSVAAVRVMATADTTVPTVNVRRWMLVGAVLGGILFPLFCWFATQRDRADEPAAVA